VILIDANILIYPSLQILNYRFGGTRKRRPDPPMGGRFVESGVLPQLSGDRNRIKLD
jgi:hypothetical protein